MELSCSSSGYDWICPICALPIFIPWCLYFALLSLNAKRD